MAQMSYEGLFSGGAKYVEIVFAERKGYCTGVGGVTQNRRGVPHEGRGSPPRINGLRRVTGMLPRPTR